MQYVEAHRDRMLAELAEHGGLTLAATVQFVADGMSCAFEIGEHCCPYMTFDEALYAIYGWNSNYWRVRGAGKSAKAPSKSDSTPRSES